jgi:hypothetical protein
MKKRTAEKVISRSILTLAIYRKDTMRRALRRRPRFWTVQKAAIQVRPGPARKRMRVEFGEAKGAGNISLEYADAGLRPATA